MSCSHIHRLTKKRYNDIEDNILEMFEFGLKEETFIGTKIKHITFDSREKVYWVEYGTVMGIYPEMKNNPIRQYVIVLQCGGRISGACGSHMKEVKFLEDLEPPFTRLSKPEGWEPTDMDSTEK
jgi:hypothetical protein